MCCGGWGKGLQPRPPGVVLQPPESGKIIFFRQSSNFCGSGQKMENNFLKIINEKYEKILHRLQQNKVPEIRALWGEAF